ncbi:MAG: calcium-binding protein [Alphaproteobacteria bacterium]
MPVTQDFIVNSTPVGWIYNPLAPTVATLADGRALVVWLSVSPDIQSDNKDSEIRARWFNADGTPAGDDFVVNTTQEGFQFAPSAAAMADGRVIVTWDSEGSLRGIFLDPDAPGTTTDFELDAREGEFQLSSGARMIHEHHVTALSDGRFFVVWESNNGADGETIDNGYFLDGFCVQGRFFAADGTALGDTMVLNATTIGRQYHPDVTELSDGCILVTFCNDDNSSVLARVILADGSLQDQDVQLNTMTDVDYESGVVAALADGRAVAVWYDEVSGSDQKEGYIRAHVIGADGLPEGDDFVVSETFAKIKGNGSLPAITALADGGALVVWQDENRKLLGHLLNADGQPVSVDFVIGSNPGYRSSSQTVEALADGRVLVSWDSSEDWNEESGPARVIKGVYFTPEMGGDGADAMAGTAGLDVMMGLGGNDVLTGGMGDDSQMGGTGQDKLLGGTGDDLMVGENGADVLNGGRGEDLLNGGAARDVLNGGAGEDVLTGGAGRDILTGGSGADTFFFDMGFGRDKIMDFSDGDMLQISDEMWSGTAESLIADHAWVTDDGVMIDLCGGERISLVGLTTLDGLADAITFL